MIREAVEIEKINNNLNKDDGLRLSNTWRHLINKIMGNWKRYVAFIENNRSLWLILPQPPIYGLEALHPSLISHHVLRFRPNDGLNYLVV